MAIYYNSTHPLKVIEKSKSLRIEKKLISKRCDNKYINGAICAEKFREVKISS